jgi:hypothetical protein
VEQKQEAGEYKAARRVTSVTRTLRAVTCDTVRSSYWTTL